MIDDLREEEIVNKVGGRFKLSTLIQKRMVALNAGGRPLVDIDSDDKMQIVIEEIKQDKIYLDTSSKLRITCRRPARFRHHDSMITARGVIHGACGLGQPPHLRAAVGAEAGHGHARRS
jgi:DNA-directed RNA polymerase subunit omega